MILNVPALSYVPLVRMIQNLMRFLNSTVMIMVIYLNLPVILQASQLPLILVLPLNRSKNLFLKLPMSALNKEVYVKSPTPSQWIQLALDVLAAIGMALLAIFK